jgi:O-antigen ligase
MAAALLASAAPTLLALNQLPSPMMRSQCLALAAWAGFAMVLAPGWRPRAASPLLAALGMLGASMWLSWQFGALPLSLALSALGMLAIAGLLTVAGADAARRTNRIGIFESVCSGLLLAGMLSSLVALVQVFLPDLAGGSWVAAYRIAGRAGGNIQQPNHLASVLLWALVALVALHELGRLPSRASPLPLWGVASLLVLAIELSASRTGAVGIALLALWALADRHLSPRARWLLLGLPVLYAASAGAVQIYGAFSHTLPGAAGRAAIELGATAGSPNSRWNIWRTTVALIAQQPWTGIGFGEFNVAWTLTVFPGRPTAFFDHAHNLVLHLLVELGLLLGGCVLVLLACSLWRAARQAWRLSGPAGTAARAGLVFVLVILLHSQLEYPLWYAYFLLPTAFLWSFVLALPAAEPLRPDPADAAPNQMGMLVSLLAVLGATSALLDYRSVVQIYEPDGSGGTLAERIERGQHSLLFSHYADYAAATTADSPTDNVALAFKRAPHRLLDTRLMVAWARWFDAHQQPALASHLVQRLIEFNSPDAAGFFAECKSPDGALRFQCQPPWPAVPWHAFLAPPPR